MISKRNDPDAPWPHPCDCMCGACLIVPSSYRPKLPEFRASLSNLRDSLTAYDTTLQNKNHLKGMLAEVLHVVDKIIDEK